MASLNAHDHLVIDSISPLNESGAFLVLFTPLLKRCSRININSSFSGTLQDCIVSTIELGEKDNTYWLWDAIVFHCEGHYSLEVRHVFGDGKAEMTKL